VSNISKLYEAYAANTARYPAILDELADQLGVSPESVARIGTGFIPVDEVGNWAWVFPERNAKGEVIGLASPNGSRMGPSTWSLVPSGV
jgi:hypothetical protein